MSMQVPLYRYLSAAAPVTALVGTRIGPFGEVDQDTPMPYVVWQTITGTPENYLDNRPDIDNSRIQIDVWAKTGVSAEQVAMAVRDALEDEGYMVSWGSTERDPETRNYRFSMDFEFWNPR